MKILYLPEHWFSLHRRDSLSFDPSTVHCKPPSDGRGLSQRLVLVSSPPPQLTGHVLHGIHSPQLPSTLNINNVVLT